MTGRIINRVVLINTPEEKQISRDMAGGLGFDRSSRTVLPPLDLLSYATVLKAEGRYVELIDSQVEDISAQQLVDRIVDCRPDAVILTLSLPTLDSDVRFAQGLRGCLPDNCLIVFKTGIRFLPVLQEVLKESLCDFCITGECDLSITGILERNDRRGTVRIDNDVVIETPEDRLQNLDELPLPDRTLLQNERYAYNRLGTNITTMQTSRGCPYSCDYYCPYPLVQGKKWRAMSVQRILAEIRDGVLNHAITGILFRDATFTLDRERIHSLCDELIANGPDFSWWCETRVDCLDETLLKSMQRAGCKGINIGIETGDKKLMAELAKKGLTPDRIVELTEFCKTIGIELHYLLMVGLPGESRETLYETFRLVDRMQPDSIGITTVTPYPGTRLYEDAVKNGWIIRPDVNSFSGHGYNLQTGELQPDDLRFAVDTIYAVSKLKDMLPEQADHRRQELYDVFESWKDGATLQSWSVSQ